MSLFGIYTLTYYIMIGQDKILTAFWAHIQPSSSGSDNPVAMTQTNWHLSKALGPFECIISFLTCIAHSSVKEARLMDQFWTAFLIFKNKRLRESTKPKSLIWCVFHSFYFVFYSFYFVLLKCFYKGIWYCDSLVILQIS